MKRKLMFKVLMGVAIITAIVFSYFLTEKPLHRPLTSEVCTNPPFQIRKGRV